MEISKTVILAAAQQIAYAKLGDGWLLDNAWSASVLDTSEGQSGSQFRIDLKASRHIEEFAPMSTEEQPKEQRRVTVLFGNTGIEAILG